MDRSAINPPSIDAYNQFLLAAKNVSLNVPVVGFPFLSVAVAVLSRF